MRKSRRILYEYIHTHVTTTRHKTRRHTTTSATLAWLLSLLLLLGASQRDTSLSTPVSSTCQHPMATVRGIDDRAPTTALAVALATLEEVQRHEGLKDEMEENAPRVTLTRCSRKKRDMRIYVWLGAPAAARRRPLSPHEHYSEPVSDRLPPTLPFFHGATAVKLHSLTSNAPRKNTKTVHSIRRTIRRVAIHNPVGKITHRKPAFSIHVSDGK